MRNLIRAGIVLVAGYALSFVLGCANPEYEAWQKYRKLDEQKSAARQAQFKKDMATIDKDLKEYDDLHEQLQQTTQNILEHSLESMTLYIDIMRQVTDATTDILKRDDITDEEKEELSNLYFEIFKNYAGLKEAQSELNKGCLDRIASEYKK